MRCSYCGSKIKPTDIVCKGCSAPVSAVNHASGWAVFFCVLSLLCSALSVYNLVLVVLGLVLILTGFHLAKKRDGKGKAACGVALVFWALGILATIAVTVIYIYAYDHVLHTVYVLLPSNVSELFEQWFGFLGGMGSAL